MAHSIATASPPFSTNSRNKTPTHLGFQRDSSMPVSHFNLIIHRRTVTLGLAGSLVGLSIGDRSAKAAARRPPPPPPQEKKDPNLSGVQAKVLASKKRKEAMKEFAAKQREKSKPINEPSEKQ